MRVREVPEDQECLSFLFEHFIYEARRADNSRLYLVSVGSNPTGITISLQRRKEIYEICKKFGNDSTQSRKQQHNASRKPSDKTDTAPDIIVVEDDPYYFLQYPHYQPKLQRQSPSPAALQPIQHFLSSLTPSFLSLDTEGRVIRLDSFSKTLFPGLRLGYFIANPLFIERLLRATEVETQDPAGLSQAFVTSLLDRWGTGGYFNWLQQLKGQYESRRNWLLDAFHANFTVLPAAESPLPGAQGLVVCLPGSKDGGLRPVFSFIDPSAGMFVWTKFYFDGVARFHELEGHARPSHASVSEHNGVDEQHGVEDPEQAFAHELWAELAAELVLLTPGAYYHPWQGPEKVTTEARGAEKGTATFRFSFATPTVSFSWGVVLMFAIWRVLLTETIGERDP
jgi:aromatic amino acid aminotransferase I